MKNLDFWYVNKFKKCIIGILNIRAFHDKLIQMNSGTK